MSWTTDLTLASARLAALEAAELALLAPAAGSGAIKRVSYEGGSVEYADGATLASIQRSLYEARQVVARLQGSRGQGGFIQPVLR